MLTIVLLILAGIVVFLIILGTIVNAWENAVDGYHHEREISQIRADARRRAGTAAGSQGLRRR